MKNTSRLIFTGDIGFDSYMEGRFKDPKILAPEVLGFLHSGDHVVANVEGALIDRSEAIDVHNKKHLFHTMDPGAIEFLRLIKADIWDFANNHTMDSGGKGLLSGIRLAAENGCLTVGAGANIEEASSPVIINEAGGIGIIAAGYQPICVAAGEDSPGVLACTDLERVGASIRRVKERCRWCVVVPHNGEEFGILPAPYTRRLYLDYLEMGADLVIAHHPHVPMNYELLPGKAIFYSLGNFIFDTNYQRAQMHTDEAVLLGVNFTEESFSFDAFPIHILRGSETVERGALQPVFTNVSGEEYELLKYMSAKAFLENEKRRQIFQRPDIYGAYREEDWVEYYASGERESRIAGVHHDLSCYAELAAQASNGSFEKSRMEELKKYILEMIPTDRDTEEI